MKRLRAAGTQAGIDASVKGGKAGTALDGQRQQVDVSEVCCTGSAGNRLRVISEMSSPCSLDTRRS